MNHNEVIKRFAERQVNKRTKTICWSGNSVYCNDKVLYSYGSHFPLAVYLGEGAIQHVFLKNTDKYSVSTSRHQGLTNQYCKGPEISRNLLENEGICFCDLTLKNVVCWEQHKSFFVKFNRKTGLYNLEDSSDFWLIPELGNFRPFKKRDKNEIVSGMWIIPSAMVLQIKKGQYFCSSDNKGQFIYKLSKKVDTIKAAFDLKQKEDLSWANWVEDLKVG